jgi:hypothetical protein
MKPWILQEIIQFMALKKQAYQPLGRWHIDPCPTKFGAKVDRANEDHCGPCGFSEAVRSEPSAKQEEKKKV